MIIIASKPGFLGNMIIMHASFLAFGLKNKVKVLDPAFHQYKGYFKGSKQNTSSEVPYLLAFFAARSLDRLGLRHTKVSAWCIDWEQHVNLDEPAEALKMSSGIRFIQGWKFRANNAMAEYRKEILDYFTPTVKYKKRIDQFVKDHFSSEHLNIGIHIRRGDYKRFEEGQYFYEVDEYLQIMQRITELFSGRKVRFMITSNEKVDPGLFSKKDSDVIFAPQHELLDMYLLTHCDFIAGPPSTYTMWASYYGEVPLCMVRKAGSAIRLEDFKVQTYF